jgi:hypothetical protein
MVSVPHFDMPFRFGTGGAHAAVVEQNTGDDVTNCVEACLRTTRGTRMFVPNFGITDPLFAIKQSPFLAIEQMQAEVQENEPRASTQFTDVGSLDAMIANIIVEVSNE